MFPVPIAVDNNNLVDLNVKNNQEQEKSNAPWTQNWKLII